VTEIKDLVRKNRAELVTELLALGASVSGGNVRCPFHDDHSPSGSVYADADGVWRYKCHAPECQFHGDIFDVRAKAGRSTVADQLKELDPARPKPRPAPAPAPPRENNLRVYATLEELEKSIDHREATYVYTHPETKRKEFIQVRYRVFNEKKGQWVKRFTTAHEQEGGGIVRVAPPKPWPLYNRTRLAGATAVMVVEGEKCVHALAAIGVVATTCPDGAGKAIHADWSPLAGKTVYLWPDNDAAGRDHMAKVAEILLGMGCAVYRIDPALAGLEGDGDDAADFLDALPETMTAPQMRDAVDAVTAGALRVSRCQELDDRLEACYAGRYVDVPWPWPATSKITQALLPGTVTMLCGEPDSAKSFLLLEAMLHWHEAGVKVALYELEEDRAYWLMRALAITSGTPGFLRPKWVRDNATLAKGARLMHGPRVEGFAGRLDAAPDEPPTHATILEWMEARAREGCRVIGIDPVTAAEQSDKPWVDDLAFMVKAKTMARRYGFSLVLVTHPRITKKGGSPLDNLAGGAAYPRFAQTILWLKRHQPPREATYMTHGDLPGDPLKRLGRSRFNRTLLVGKARNGTGGGMDVAFDFSGERLRFAELGVVVDDDDPPAPAPTTPGGSDDE
jgi:hypothetical protein